MAIDFAALIYASLYAKKEMKIGTWNLDAKWSDDHEAFLREESCDIWLLTEVSKKVSMRGFYLHCSTHKMQRDQHYAAILSRSALKAIPDPHAASAAAVIEGIHYCSSILPWASCGQDPSSPWEINSKLEDKVAVTINKLMLSLPAGNLVWGGDWNQNLFGGWQHVGCSKGRILIEEALLRLNLQNPTAGLSHQQSGYTIDHIALPKRWNCYNARSVEASNLSDHAAYIVEAAQVAVRQ